MDTCLHQNLLRSWMAKRCKHIDDQGACDDDDDDDEDEDDEDANDDEEYDGNFGHSRNANVEESDYEETGDGEGDVG